MSYYQQVAKAAKITSIEAEDLTDSLKNGDITIHGIYKLDRYYVERQTQTDFTDLDENTIVNIILKNSAKFIKYYKTYEFYSKKDINDLQDGKSMIHMPAYKLRRKLCQELIKFTGFKVTFIDSDDVQRTKGNMIIENVSRTEDELLESAKNFANYLKENNEILQQWKSITTKSTSSFFTLFEEKKNDEKEEKEPTTEEINKLTRFRELCEKVTQFEEENDLFSPSQFEEENEENKDKTMNDIKKPKEIEALKKLFNLFQLSMVQDRKNNRSKNRNNKKISYILKAVIEKKRKLVEDSQNNVKKQKNQ
jgi:hypothetical protein